MSRDAGVLEQILVPVDFSETSDRAVDYGCTLAALFGSRLHLLHVVEAPHIGPTGAALWSYSLPALVKRLERSAEKRMADYAARPDQPFAVERVARLGEPFVEIVRYAHRQGIDLIVMGTHGRGAVAHLLLGSVAERVVRKAPCAVMTVRDRCHEFVMP